MLVDGVFVLLQRSACSNPPLRVEDKGGGEPEKLLDREVGADVVKQVCVETAEHVR